MMKPHKPVIKKLHALTHEGKKYSFSLPLRNVIKIGKREYTIELREDDKYGIHVLWKNRRYPVEIVRTRQNRYEILFNDISYTFTVETPISLERKKVLSASVTRSDKHVVNAPMPGKITEVFVRENAAVKRGEPIVILEAMKMQNEIQSTVTGTVSRIGVKPGQNVMKDDILVEITVK
ncbi:MAG TPA: biotin/lipoyl-containing protein [Bacteroidales bacterium]|nr:biotin/lipoyl-containing protein [Bacteroidales bacterium]